MTASSNHWPPKQTAVSPNVTIDRQAAQNSPPPVVRGRVLIVAYHFPPQAGSSGLLRSLKFCRYLPEFGWLPTVLTIDPRAYERTDSSQMTEVSGLRECHQGIRPGFATASFAGWTLSPHECASRSVGHMAGRSDSRRTAQHQEDIRSTSSLTTYPIATAVLIGYFLHVLSGKPWIVDFRDSMTEEGYPQDPRTRRIYRWIERKAINMDRGSCLLRPPLFACISGATHSSVRTSAVLAEWL